MVVIRGGGVVVVVMVVVMVVVVMVVVDSPKWYLVLCRQRQIGVVLQGGGDGRLGRICCGGRELAGERVVVEW